MTIKKILKNYFFEKKYKLLISNNDGKLSNNSIFKLSLDSKKILM